MAPEQFCASAFATRGVAQSKSRKFQLPTSRRLSLLVAEETDDGDFDRN